MNVTEKIDGLILAKNALSIMTTEKRGIIGEYI